MSLKMKWKLLVVGFCMLLAAESILVQAETLNVTTYAVAGSSTWTVPTGVTSILVEAQGGGGGSGGCAANSDTAGGGGGGGGYAGQLISVTPGETYTVTVGAAGSAASSGDNDGGVGELSRFNNSDYQINATGGAGGLRGSTGTGGAGGTGASSFSGTPITYTGGNGADKSSTNRSGAGGGGASRSGDANSGVTTTAGNGTSPLGGVGGVGRTNNGAGTVGVAFSSGAGGSTCGLSGAVRAGAAGTVGVVRLTYNIPSADGYPSIINISQGSEVTDSSSHTVTMPSGLTAGDLLLMIISSDGNMTINTSTDISWSLLHFRNSSAATVIQAVFYKIADGTETISTIQSNVSEMISYMVFVIRDAGAPTALNASGSSTNANPPLLNSGVSQKYLWMAAVSWDSIAGFAATAMPSGFNSFIHTTARNLNSATTAASWYYFENASLDPGTFTSTTEQWVASTIAIPYNATPEYVVTDVPVNLSIVLANDTNVKINETSQSGVAQALIKNSVNDKIVALVEINFTNNISIGGLSGDIDFASKKSYVHGHASVSEIINISLLIPMVSGSGNVFICPGVESIDQVNTACSGIVNIGVGETVSGMTLSETSYEGENYYLVTNITGTGGGEADASNLLQCVFVHNITCPSGTWKLIGVKNDSGGFNNAHAQNNTLNNYNYSLCCNSTNASIALSTTCPGNDTVIRLSNQTNAHVELGNLSNYSYLACIGSNWKKANCEYPVSSCAANYACVLSMAGSEGVNQTNAHVGDCSSYYQKVCCALTNFAPVKPTLYYPANNNMTVFERKPNFNWSSASDPDGGFASYYTLNFTCGSCSAGCYQPNIGTIATTNYTIQNALCVDKTYNWSVTACDSYGDCNTSAVSNFTILSQANLVLIVNATSFGPMALGQNNDTTDNGPPPLVARNIGNVLLNVSTNATKLFVTADMNTYNYQFKADQQEAGSYDIACSQDSSFVNMDNVTPKMLFCNLSYVDANDEGQLELNVTIPISEPPGLKSSDIELSYAGTEGNY